MIKEVFGVQRIEHNQAFDLSVSLSLSLTPHAATCMSTDLFMSYKNDTCLQTCLCPTKTTRVYRFAYVLQERHVSALLEISVHLSDNSEDYSPL